MSIYECEFCGKEYKTAKTKSRHIRLNHPENYQFNKRQQTECPQCGKLISNSNIKQHILGKNCLTPKIHVSTKICCYCNRESKSNIANSQHQVRCAENPNRIVSSDTFKEYNRKRRSGETKTWNKGLTKETDDRVKMSAEKRVYNIKYGNTIPHSTPHTEETKKLISKKRIEYLAANPDKVPYLLNHYSKGPSYPEKYFRQILDNNNITYETEKRIGLYSLDFCIGSIDLEIDGEQHYVDERIVKSDIKRTEYLQQIGYAIIRIRWSYYKKLNKTDQIKFVEDLINKLNNGAPSVI